MPEEFKLRSLMFEYPSSAHFFCLLFFFGQNLSDIENKISPCQVIIEFSLLIQSGFFPLGSVLILASTLFSRMVVKLI